MNQLLLRNIVDTAEKVTLMLLSVAVIVRFAPTLSYRPENYAFLLGECVTVFMVLIRRRGEIALSPVPLLVAFLGTSLPLLARPEDQPLLSASVSLPLMLGGLAVSVWAKLSLARSFGYLVANRGIKRRGAYAIVRHPMYLGYIISQIGLLIANPSLWNLGIIAMAWLFQGIRIAFEERYLRNDAAYRDYAERVRYKLIPGFI